MAQPLPQEAPQQSHVTARARFSRPKSPETSLEIVVKKLKVSIEKPGKKTLKKLKKRVAKILAQKSCKNFKTTKSLGKETELSIELSRTARGAAAGGEQDAQHAPAAHRCRCRDTFRK
jgi:hypothetical protein